MRKSEQVCARVTPEVMASLRALADRQSMLLSEYIRRALAEKLNELATPNASNETGSSHHQVGDLGFRYRYR